MRVSGVRPLDGAVLWPGVAEKLKESLERRGSSGLGISKYSSTSMSSSWTGDGAIGAPGLPCSSWMLGGGTAGGGDAEFSI